MGGKALKQVETRRYTTAEILIAAEKIERVFADGYSREMVEAMVVPKWFTTKETHGDLDFLVFAPDARAFGAGLRDFLRERLGAAEVVHNGDVWSFNYGDLQVDLNICDPADREMAPVWFSYNDLSVLLGRIFRYWHLKWSPQGLLYELFAENRAVKLGEILINRDPARILTAMGYSWERYTEGFATMDDVFAYVASSPMFSRDCCNPKYINNNTKLRDAKRENVAIFEEWLRERNDIPDFPRPSHEEAIAFIEEYFPEAHLRETIARLEAEHAIRKDVSAKFNGTHIEREFGLQGKEIGTAIGAFRGHFGDAYNEFILNNEYEEIVREFRRVVGIGGSGAAQA